MAERGQRMKRVCAWCGRDMGEGGPGEGVTHGICEDCFVKVERGEGLGAGAMGQTTTAPPGWSDVKVGAARAAGNGQGAQRDH